MIVRRDFLAAIALTPAAVAFGRSAVAAGYPDHTVKILSPYVPGGGADILARVLGEQFRAQLGQPFITENKPGAGGILALEEVGHAKPDGYTLMLGNITSNTITPLLFPKKLTIDYDKAVVPVARLAQYPAFLLASPKFEAKTFQDFVAYARKYPGKVRYGTPGVGSYPHFDTVLLARAAGLDLVHIPNKGGGAAVLKDVATGDAQIGFVNVVSSAALMRSGQVRALAVVYDHRLPEFPDVPTLAELGYPGIGTMSTLSLFTTGGTPEPVLETLSNAVGAALESAAVKDIFAKSGMIANPTHSPAEAKAWLAADMAHWRKIIADAKIDLEGN